MRQNLVVKLSAQDCCQSERFLRCLRELSHSSLDCQADALGNLQLIHPRSVPAPVGEIQLAAIDQGLTDFLNEERVALRLSVYSFQEFGRDLLAEHSSEQVVGFLSVQASEFYSASQPFVI